MWMLSVMMPRPALPCASLRRAPCAAALAAVVLTATSACASPMGPASTALAQDTPGRIGAAQTTPGGGDPVPGPAPVGSLPDAPPAATPAPTAPVVKPARLSAAQAEQLRSALRSANAEGVIAAGAGADQAGVKPVALSDLPPREVAEAALQYARAVHASRLAPADYLHDWGLRPAAYDPTPGFNAAVASDALDAWLASLPPPYAGYDGLKKGLAFYRRVQAAGGWPVLPAGEEMTLGAAGPRVSALRRRLAIEDGGNLADGAADAPYDQALAEEVARAQRRFGLRPTGVTDAATLAELNVPAAHRVVQIEANMERWRWLPPTLPADRIQVNIAAAVLTLFKADQPVTSMRAVTGRPDDATPMLQSVIHSVVLNPPWNVPSSIATKELWPKEHAHKGYLARNYYKLIKTPDGGTRLQQAAGDHSALGRVKFDFPNPYGVYLHDTPNHGAFGKYARLVSHGCVRLERPADLAALVLNGSAEAPDKAAVQSIIDKGDTTRVSLPEPLSVYLLYWTAYAGPDGRINFRADPYNWDETLVSRLKGATPGPARPDTMAAR